MLYHMHKEIDNLKNSLLNLSSYLEQTLDYTAEALIGFDPDLAKKVIKRDETINEMEVEIEEDCLKILALYQPVAADLRLVIAILKINNDLERMGDLCRNVCRYIRKINKSGAIPIPEQFTPMFNAVKEMVQKSLESLINNNASTALLVTEMDQVVDDYNIEIIKYIRKQLEEENSPIKQLLFLMSICRSVERIGDYATNIAEDVCYLICGHIVRHNNYEIDVEDTDVE
jgi:phosphate transport system protein